MLRTLVNKTIIFQFFCCVNKKSMLKKTAVMLEMTSFFSSFAFRSFWDYFCAFHFFVFNKSHKNSVKIFTFYFAKEWRILTNFGADFVHFLTNFLLKATKKAKFRSVCRNLHSPRGEKCVSSGNILRKRHIFVRHLPPFSCQK